MIIWLYIDFITFPARSLDEIEAPISGDHMGFSPICWGA